MALYLYVKSPPSLPRSDPQGRFFSVLLFGLGVLILGIVLGSIALYQLRSEERFQKKAPLFSPIPQRLILGKSTRNLSPADYTASSRWFSSTSSLPLAESKITHYNLSIPVLKIHQAVVEIGGEDLGKSMIHYPGTAFPGKQGTAVIFCHSVLPQFFNPKNYKTICSTLPTIEIGDEILVYFDGVEYRYQVVEMFEVQPVDISVLEQDMTGEYLNLITCVPPGTYLRRLVVKARLI